MIACVMVPDFLYNYGLWYLEWTSNDIGNYLGPCSTLTAQTGSV